MPAKRSLSAALPTILAAVVALTASPRARAQDVPIRDWPAAKTWSPASASVSGTKRLLTDATHVLPFVGVAPCRLADTRGLAGFSGQAGGPILAGNVARTFQLTGTVPGLSTQCGVPTTAEAVSVNFTVTGMNTNGNLVAYPQGTARPNTSVINWNATSVALGNSAAVPVSAGGAIDVFPNVPAGGQTHLIIDVNGYYASSRVSGESLQIFGSVPPSNALLLANNSAIGGVGIRGVGLSFGVRGDSLGSGVVAGVWGRSDDAYGVYGLSLNSTGIVANSQTMDGLSVAGGRDGAVVFGVRNGLVASTVGTPGTLYGVMGVEASNGVGSAGVRGDNYYGPPQGALAFVPAGVLATGISGYAFLAVTQYNGGVAGSFRRLNDVSPYLDTSHVELCPTGSVSANFFGDVTVNPSSAPGTGNGNLHVVGTLSKGGGSFQIDHPLDPENKYLYHSFVESPDMMNVYNGNVILDSRGEAVVVLPEYFEALNSDFRYQLTSIGRFSQVYVADEIEGNRFRIAGGHPGAKVSWQVTGIRQDAFAKAHRIPVEAEKPDEEKGLFLHPTEHGKPIEKSVTTVLESQARAKEKAEAVARH